MKRVLARLIASQVCLHAGMAGVRMAAPLLALREGRGAVEVGILLALFALAQVFLAVPAGRHADRQGVRRPVMQAAGVACAGTAAAAIWPLFPVLCVAALATGGATGAASIALQRHVGRVAGEAGSLRQAFSWLSIGPAGANFAGPMLAGLLIDGPGFRAAFVVMALLPVLSAVLIHAAAEIRAGAPTPDADALRPHPLDLLRHATLRRLLVTNWVLSSCWDVHLFLVPLLGHERGLSASAIGFILGAFAIAATVVRLLLPLVAERLREWQVLVGAMLAAAFWLALYPFCTAVWSMTACSVGLGLTLGTVQPMVMSMLHQVTPRHRQGEALGLRLMAVNLASVLMPLAFGGLGLAVGAAGLFWGVGALVTATVPLAARLRHPEPDGSQIA